MQAGSHPWAFRPRPVETAQCFFVDHVVYMFPTAGGRSTSCVSDSELVLKVYAVVASGLDPRPKLSTSITFHLRNLTGAAWHGQDEQRLRNRLCSRTIRPSEPAATLWQHVKLRYLPALWQVVILQSKNRSMYGISFINRRARFVKFISYCSKALSEVRKHFRSHWRRTRCKSPPGENKH